MGPVGPVSISVTLSRVFSEGTEEELPLTQLVSLFRSLPPYL